MGGKTTTTKNTFDPVMQGIVKDNVTRATGVADNISQPYTGDLSAGTTPEMQSYFDAAQAVQGSGQPLLGSATGIVQHALGYTPMQITAPTMTAANAGQAHTADTSGILGNLNTATAGGVDRGAVRDVNLGAFGADQIRALYNPFEQDKVNSALNDYDRARQIAQNNDASRFGAGSWGGSRQGVQGAQTNEAALRASDAAVNDIRLQGWNSAMQGALGARGQDLSAAQGNQSADLGVAGMNNQTGMFNAGQRNAANQLGTQLGAQLGMFNTGAQNDFAQNQATRDQQTGAINQADQLQALLANQTAGLQGNAQQLQGAGLLGDLSNSTVNQGLAQTQLLGQAGTAQQGLAQDELTRQYQAWLQNYQNQLAGQGAVTSATGIIPSITDRTQTEKTDPGLLGTIGAGLGLAGQIGGLFATGGASALGSVAAPSMAGFGLNLPNLSGFMAA